MRRFPSWFMIALIALATIGLVGTIISNPTYFLIPLVLAVIIFALYKWGPKRTAAKPRIKKSARTEAKVKRMQKPVVKHKAERRRSTASLTVIDGNKSKPKSKTNS
ncbi:hypothetical protein [Paenibacillus sp. UMB4589-SE434]|uniref:hypothetical protein n=1 Tax=Paenibacillus sp. UMB4589-SE434 TaxID=3046314 RepID=UPI0025506DDF|nr:hypothetical protein [Paenibacillus sp. UMB4589-SE434]MDK8179320.1 hypothetical protein [Paenibacillus sp. UMB4589-SE434]